MEDKYTKISQLAKRRGFFWQSYDIYGGVGGFISLGPLGVDLKENIVRKWEEVFINPYRDFIVKIETPIISPEIVFKASGHIDHFTDYIVECTKCHRKYRADHLIEEKLKLKNLERYSAEELTKLIKENGIKCPECGGELGSVERFNLLFKTTIGPYSKDIGYLRPETAQGMFLNFYKIYEALGRKLPIGIAQIGRVMRNEISPRQGLIRLREFTIMEIELFFDPKNPTCPYIGDVENEVLRIISEGDLERNIENPREILVKDAIRSGIILNEWNAFFMVLAKKFLLELGVPENYQLFIAKLPEERAHYSAQTYDQLVYIERWGWVEVSGHSYRTDYDLKRHMKFGKSDLRAYRFLKVPIVKKIKRIKPNISLIRKKFMDKTPEILRTLSRINTEDLLNKLESNGYIILENKKLDKDMFLIKEEEVKEYTNRFIPHVAEPSFGVERLLYIVMEHAFHERDGRIILSIPRDLSPIKVAVFPLIKKDELVRKSMEVYNALKKENLPIIFSKDGSIGKRYALADEIGIPFSITVDRRTLEDNSVTIRDRDTWKQIRISIDKINKFIKVGIKSSKKSLEKIAEEI